MENTVVKYAADSKGPILSMKNDANVVWGVIEELQKTYAKTIEMTRDDKDTFDMYKCFSGMKGFETLLTFGRLSNVSEEDLMYAWLHPDSVVIKEVVNHENV